MIMSTRKESGEITSDREEILKICSDFYKSHYTQTVLTTESTMKQINQITEKSNEYILPLCIDFTDYEKAFDTIEHFAILEALRKTNINETYINILQNIYSQATASIYLDKLVSDELHINREIRQGDPLSPKLFTADISEGINVVGENLTNLRFADDVALLSENNNNNNKRKTKNT